MRITRNGMLGARLSAWSDWLRSSLWAVPIAQVIAAVALAVLTLSIDTAYGEPLAARVPFDVGPEGIRTTVATISGAILTVAGVAFSITVVVLQLASSQYSPRIIRTFRRDRVIQIVLGLYTGTFVYSVLVLRTIRSGAERPAFIAPLSVTIVMVLAIACMVALIALVHHVAHQVQASTVVREIATETQAAIEALFPEPLGADVDAPDPPPPQIEGTPQPVCAWCDGYVEFVDTTALERIAGARLARVLPRVGDFVRRGECVAQVWIDGRSEGDALDAGAVFVLANARTIRQDVRYGLRLVVDVALRALSPSIHDPTTAMECVDVLGGLLCEIAKRKLPSSLRASEGRTPVYAPRPSRAELLAVAFEEIVSAARSPRVLIGVAEALTAIEAARPGADFGGAIEALRSRIAHVARTADAFPPDLERIARALGARSPA